MSETALVKTCLEYLWYNKVFAYRQNTGAFTSEYAGKTRFIQFGTKGAPDIIAVIKGIYVGIECKYGKGKQTPNQKDFQKRLEKAGGVYWLVYSVEALDMLFKNLQPKNLKI